MTRRPLLIGAVSAVWLCIASAAGAISVIGPDVIDDSSGPGLISFSVDFIKKGPTIVTVDVTGEAGILELEAVLLNNTPHEWAFLEIDLTNGATFETIGDLTDGGSTFFEDDIVNNTRYVVSFAPDTAATRVKVELGDPFATTGASSWQIDLGLLLGSSFEMVIDPTPIPEPSTAVLVGMGLGALGLRRRRPVRRASSHDGPEAEGGPSQGAVGVDTSRNIRHHSSIHTSDRIV